jgi:CBS domain-containing protein
MRAGDLAVDEPALACEPTTPLAEVARRMLLHDTVLLPVLRDGRILGAITAREIAIDCIGQGHETSRCTAGDHLTRRPVTVEPEADLVSCARAMLADGLRSLLVVDGTRLLGFLRLRAIPGDARGAAAAGLATHRVVRRPQEPRAGA